LQEERILPLFTTRRASRRFRVFGVRLNLAAATLVLVAILIACTAVLFPFIPGSGNTAEAKQYQLVGLSQSSHGTTFVADKAYASEGGTIIQFHVQPSPDLMKFMKTGNFTSTRPGTFTIKDQTEELKSSAFQTTCYSFQHSGWPIKCALVLSAFHPPANVTTLTLTWDVSSIFLGNNGPDGQWSKEIQGTWHFHFVINFHHGKFLPALSGA